MSCCDYVFIGHGWDIENKIDTTSIPEGIEIQLVILSSCSILYEDPIYSKNRVTELKELTRSYFIKQLRKLSLEFNNEFCIYTLKRGSEVPDMLLTTVSRRSVENNLILKQRYENKVYKKVHLKENTYLLSELVGNLFKREKKGFSLLVYACRKNLFEGKQIEWLEQGGIFENDEQLKRKVKKVKEKRGEPVLAGCKEWIGKEVVERYRKYKEKQRAKEREEDSKRQPILGRRKFVLTAEQKEKLKQIILIV